MRTNEHPNPPSRSRFITVLGWFLAVVGGLSIPVRVHALVRLVLGSDASPALQGRLRHPIEVFVHENAVLVGITFLIAAFLLLIVGIGLIRRRVWTYPVGALFLLLGGLRQASALFLVLSDSSSAFAGLAPERAQDMTTMVVCLYSVSLLWLLFLLWFFSRPSVRAEFSAHGSAA